MAKWPSKASFRRGKCKLNAEDIISYRKSHAKVRIFFSTLDRIIYVQKPAFLVSEIFSHLGGVLGLWAGLSIIAVFGLIEALLYFIRNKIRDLSK
ncbi:degenerin mec-10 [Caerostris extrusa]|uniref:Degenerin mec-10 n=1 Tax=Caerostris extrusa TaxID=172846 RepID=A0AAV4MZ97_CAEEX|nr:degenerin mec-10 [Caerostris extrusa]